MTADNRPRRYDVIDEHGNVLLTTFDHEEAVTLLLAQPLSSPDSPEMPHIGSALVGPPPRRLHVGSLPSEWV